MNLTASIKKAPKWAWYVAGGVGAGIVGIEVWKRRATDAANAADATNAAQTGTNPTTGAAGGAPSPVITPPVIIGAPSSDSSGAADVVGILGGSFDNLVASIGSLAAGDQNITTTIAGSLEGISRDIVAAAGGAPSPVSQQGPGIVPTTKPGTHAAGKCPSSFPRLNGARVSASTCYTCRKAQQVTGKPDSRYPWRHIYQSGKVVKAKGCP